MPSLNFQSGFAASISNGSKACTIRAWRQRPIKVGDTLAFFTGMRTKRCRRLRPNTRCTRATPIKIESQRRQITLGRIPLRKRSVESLARKDGYASVEEFWRFFLETHGPVLRGQMIEWEP
jgi:hypothetical protein